MEGFLQAKKLIEKAQNILVLTSKNPGVDNLSSALSLSYTLNNAGKIVNFFPKKISETYFPLFPKKAAPESFVISIQGKEISELYYEKENQILKIFLTSRSDKIKREDVKFSSLEEISAQKSDLLITCGIERLESLGNFYEKNFRLFYQTPILNIDNQSLNSKFGNINLVIEDLPTAIISDKLIRLLAPENEDKNIKTWLLAGIIGFSQKKRLGPEALEAVFRLKNPNLFYQKLIEFFVSPKNPVQEKLLTISLKKLEFNEEKQLPFICLTRKDFEDSQAKDKDLVFVLENLINKIFRLPSLLLLWESDSPYIGAKGIFYSSVDINPSRKILRYFKGEAKGKGTLFEIKERDIDKAREKVIEAIS